MKRVLRTLALVLALLFLLPQLPLARATDVTFTSINNTLLPLSDDTMPIQYNATVYLPYLLFNSRDLGTYAVYLSSSQKVTVFSSNGTLIFDIKNGGTEDAQGEVFEDQHAINHNGRIYVPALFTSQYFDITITTIPVEYGSILRLKHGQAYSDETFAEAATVLLKSRLDDYLSSIAGPSEETDPPYQDPTPSRPQNPLPPAPDHSDTDVYLSFFGLSGAEKVLDVLDEEGLPACFFVRGEDILEYPGLIRRICGTGYGIGLIGGDDPAADYAEGIALLYEAAHTSSFLLAVLPAEADEAEGENAEESVEPASPARADYVGPALYLLENAPVPCTVSDCRELLIHSEGRADLPLLCEEDSAQGLTSLLRVLQEEKYNVQALTEYRAAVIDNAPQEETNE